MNRFVVLLLSLVSLTAGAWTNGALWYDTNGHVVNAHGGGVLAHGGRYYLYGEHKIYSGRGNRAHAGVHMYSSTDLETWKDEGLVLQVEDKAGSDIEDGCILERPKVVRCAKTGKFVMFFHLELKGQGYNAARTGIAVADKVTGPYVFQRSLRPNAGQWPVEIPEAERNEATLRKFHEADQPWGGKAKIWGDHFKGGQMSRDMTVYIDRDGTAYHVFASENNATLHVCELTDDYLDYTGRWTRMAALDWTEAPAVCFKDGWYYLIGSDCTGWRPNAARSYRAKTMMGPWERLGNPAKGVNPKNKCGPELTWGGQSNYMLELADGRTLAMFDLWNPKNQIDSRLVWLPVDFAADNTISITWRDTYTLKDTSLAVKGPSGQTVCTVTPPDYGPGAVIETTNLTEGVAWRVKFSGEGTRTLQDETWTFDFGKDLRCWPVSHAQGEYVPKTLSTIATMKERPDFAPVAAGIGAMHNYATSYPGTAESPLVVEGSDFVAALGDAGVLDYARIRFAHGTKPGEVKTLLEGPATVKLPYVTPWRYLHVAKDPVALANAQPALMDALNAPSEIADTSWIKPGKVLRVAKLDTGVGKAAVDFAKRNGMQYIELDCGWYGQEHTGDPLKPGLAPERIAKGETFDFFAILDYAKAQDVGVILYVNREPLKKNRDAILDQLVAWGVKGVKYGFVNVGNQEWRAWVTDAIRAAAKRKLMVNIHDEYRLTGIQKTFPNVLTVEGICGNEEMPNAAHDCALPFTRYLDGPGDYTPCWSVGRVKNTLAHQLALPCVYTSGWQFLFWYQRPDQIKESDPALNFWRELPTAFDETRFLQGEIGKFVVVARRKGKTWFVGGLNAGATRTFTVPLDFVSSRAKTPTSPSSHKIRLFRDADPSVEKSLAPIACETLELASDADLVVTAASNGGWAAIVEIIGNCKF